MQNPELAVLILSLKFPVAHKLDLHAFTSGECRYLSSDSPENSDSPTGNGLSITNSFINKKWLGATHGAYSSSHVMSPSDFPSSPVGKQLWHSVQLALLSADTSTGFPRFMWVLYV